MHLYGDFFVVAERGVVILGAGKSKAGRVAAEMHPLAVASTDNLELGLHGDGLVCRNVGPRMVEDDSRWRAWLRVDYFALCLDDETTDLVYRDRPLAVLSVPRDVLANAAAWYLCFPEREDEAPHRLGQFRELTEDPHLGFLIVPTMESHEAKGGLLRSFLLEQP